ncbi:MAG: hypothetical protein PHX61_01500, partial [Alphaproteobacteria bacterium]|nr:hypothetical protein [Alphaproteobacteria bacterium]
LQPERLQIFEVYSLFSSYLSSEPVIRVAPGGSLIFLKVGGLYPDLSKDFKYFIGRAGGFV